MRTMHLMITNEELKKKYSEAVQYHNTQTLSTHPNAGFDLFNPEDVHTNCPTITIDTQVVCSLIDDNDNNCCFYLYPRSSISKTKLRMANSIGIIDSGYRGNLIGVFDNDGETDIKKHTRLLQICSGDLQPFLVKIVDSLSSTNRGVGGFGSTGI